MNRRNFLHITALSALPWAAEALRAEATRKFTLPPGRSFGDGITAIATDTAGNTFVSHTGGTAGVSVFSPNGAWLRDLAPEYAGVGQGVAISGTGEEQQIYVAGNGPGALGGVTLYNAQGKSMATWLSQGITSITTSPEGKLFVAKAAQEHSILCLDLNPTAKPKILWKWGKRGRGPQQILHPQGLFATTTELGVCDKSNRRLHWLSLNGKWLRSQPVDGWPIALQASGPVVVKSGPLPVVIK